MSERSTRPEYTPPVESALPTQAIDAVQALISQRGRTVALEFIRDLEAAVRAGRVPNREEILTKIERVPTRDVFQAFILDRLEKKGAIRRDDGQLVVDPNMLFAFIQNKSLIPKQQTDFKKSEFATSVYAILAATFVDQTVRLHQEDGNVSNAKTLFYVPRTRAEAFDQETIRDQSFHYGLWQIPRAGKVVEKEDFILQSPQAEETFSALGANVAAALFHPDYGDAQRDDQGHLSVVYADRERRPLRAQWFREQGFVVKTDEGIALDDAPYPVLFKYAPELFQSGLLRQKDFMVKKSYQREAWTQVRKNGEMRIHGVTYSIGRAFAGASVRAERFGSNQFALFVPEASEPILILNALDEHDPRLAQHTTTTGTILRARQVDTRPRSVQDFLDEQKAQGFDVLTTSLQELDAIKFLHYFEDRLEAKTQISVWELSEVEHERLRTLIPIVKQSSEEIIAMAEDFGLDGLRIAVAYMDLSQPFQKMREMIHKVHPSDQSFFVQHLLALGAQRIDTLEQLNQAQSEGRLTEAQTRTGRFEINRRATSMLVAMQDAVKSDPEHPDALKELLQGSKFETGVFSHIFRDAFKGSEVAIDVESLQGVSLEQKHPHALSAEDKEDMTALVSENWALMGTDYAQYVMDGFQKKINGKTDDTLFHIMRKDGKIIAFVRFDTRDDLEPGALYAGSLNVHPSLKGSAIGEVILRRLFDTTASKHTLYADVFPEILAGTAYVEKFGWVITGVEQVDLGKGKRVQRFTIVRDDTENATYLARQKQVTHENIKNQKGVRVLEFDISTQKGQMMSMLDDATRRGNVVTRYWYDPKNQNKRFFAIEPALAQTYDYQDVV